jgi:hypothetical protein
VDVQQWVDALQIDEATRSELLSLARVANAEYQDVRASVRRGLHHRQRELAALEKNATDMRHFLPTLVTGLLQTHEYMRAAMNAPAEPASTDISKAIAMKLDRQSVLYDPSKRFEFILTESAIRWRLCPPVVLALQLDRLVSISRLPNVRIGILPLNAQVQEGPYNTFVTYDRKLVTVELFSGRLALRDPKDIGHYRVLFDFFATSALWGENARDFLLATAGSFRQDG